MYHALPAPPSCFPAAGLSGGLEAWMGYGIDLKQLPSSRDEVCLSWNTSLQDPLREASWAILQSLRKGVHSRSGERHNNGDPLRPRSVGSLLQRGLLRLVQLALASDSEQAPSLLKHIAEE